MKVFPKSLAIKTKSGLQVATTPEEKALVLHEVEEEKTISSEPSTEEITPQPLTLPISTPKTMPLTMPLKITTPVAKPGNLILSKAKTV